MSFRYAMMAVLSLSAAAVGAQTVRYVSDELVVNVRTGQSNAHAIVRMLRAGTAVEVLEQDEESGYSRVIVPDRGTEGWVLTQYLTPEPIARDKLALTERELTAARGRIAELEARVQELSREMASTAERLGEKDSANAGLHEELADIRKASANVLSLREENQDLKRQLADRERETRQFAEENALLANRERQHWFFAGASVMFGGIVLGLILPRMRRRRRTDW